MKRIISLVLSLSILMSLFGGLDISVFATTETPNISEIELIDLDIYKAQCLAGIAYDPNSNAVELCNSMYNYYINDNIHSPTQTFLEECYNDDALMADYTEWMAYSLAASPSSALDYVMKKEDYYETLIIAMYSKALTEDSEWKKIINNKIVNDTTNILSGLCDVLKLEQASQLDEILDLSDPKTFEYVSDTVEKYYPVGTAGKVVGIIGTALKYGQNITDACQRISTYNAMVELDNSAKLWLSQMYESCDGNTDPSLKAALLDLKSASTGFAEAALVDIKEASFSLANWSIQAVMDYGVAQLAALNPITASVVVGLQAGKTICNVFFATDDVCEQLFLMECIYDVQHLSRIVADDCKATFIDNQTKNNALSFTFSVECYYESIIDVDIDCMIKFLDKLYNGGILKGFLKWIYGATDDYDQCVAALEALRTARIDNYNAMNDYYRQALQINYPDTYKYYFFIEQIVPITGIGFQKYTILPPGYPADYANIIVDSFSYVEVYFEPSNTTQKAYTLTSDNPNVLEINEGVMTAISEGTANVTVTSLDNPAVSYTSEIKVGAKLVDVDIDTSTTRFKYKIENNEIIITGLVSGYNPETLQIPEAISEYPVTKIADFAFLKNKSIKSITLPSTVTEIGDYAFYKCSVLTQINFSEGLTVVGDGAFGSCSALIGAVLPSTVTDLGLSAFENGTSLINVQLSNNITELKDRTFYNCDALEEITIPKYVTKFGQGIFSGCDSLKKVFFGINKSPTTNKQIYHTSSTLQNIKSITISDDVQIIDTMCFYGTDLYSITIPDSIKTIGGYIGDYSDLNHIFYEGTESSWSSLISKASQYGSTQTLSKIKNAGHIHFEVSLQNNTSIKDQIAPTCTADGSNNIYCNICNELLGSEVIPATGHVGKLVQKVLPTCTEQGYSKYYCIVCDEEYITDYVNATHQHNYDENGSCYVCDQNIYFDYSISNDEVTITGYLTDKSTITVPSHIEFLPVKHIANNAFESCTVIENIKLSNSITSIGEKAFADCTSIANIDIPDSVISIGEYAFSNCSNMETITIGSAVTSIGNYAFADCINVVQINYNATDASENINADSYNLFENAGTSGEGIEVIVGNNVKTIPENLFWSHNQYSYVPPKIISATIGRNVEIIGDGAFARCSDLINITFYGNKLTTIEDEAFSGCNFTSLSLPKSLKSIGWLSFARCPIESIVIPGGMTNIGDSAFYWCEELSNVVIEDGATVIGGFEGCTSIKQIQIPDSVTTINSGAFYGCSSLEEIDFGNGVTTISKNAFYGCSSIQKLNLPDELVYIGKSAFGNCDGLTKVIIPNKVESIEEYAFEGCSSLKEIKLGNSVKNIGKSAFYTCWSLNAAFIPKSVANIGDGAFDSHSFWHVFYEGNAEDWSTITIGDSNDEFINATRHYNVTEYDITYLVEDEPTCLGGGSASYNCSICNDKQYLILSQLEHNGNLLSSIPQSCNSEGYDLYRCTYCGQEYRLNIVEPIEHELSLIDTIDGGCTIGSVKVYQCLNCNDYCYMPDSVATKEHGFQNGSCADCHVQEGWEYSIAPSKDGIIVTKYTGSNEEVVIPDSFFGIPVISIGARAFQDCSVIKSIIVPNSVVSLEGDVFMNCSQLETVTLGNNVTSIGYSVFENCSSLENIYIPSSVTSIKGRAFSNCENLKNVYITDIKAWCKTEFEWANSSPMYYATNLYVNDELITDLIIPDGITYLPHYAFSCENIETVTIPDSVLSMGQGVFENCTNLESVYITDIKSWCQIDYNASRSPLYYANKLYVNDELITDLIIPDGIIKIPSYAFSCQNIKSVVIPESVTTIGDGAFDGCSDMTTITIPSGIMSIGDEAFNGCYSLDSVHISDLTAWCNIDFSYYGNPLVYAKKLYLNGTIIKDLIIPDGVDSIKSRAFEGGASIRTITVPDSVVSIGDWAFQSCSNVFSIMLPITLTDIGYSTFNYCYSLEHVVYAGSQDDWNKISIGNSNEQLTSATIHYNCSNDIIYSETIAPTCTEEGQVTHKCDLCELEIVEQLEALGHNGVAIETIAPTCTNDGYTIYQCSECGETYNADWVYSTGHTKGDVVESVVPSCTQDGYTRYNCSVCGMTFTTDWVWAQGHTKDEIVSVVDPTCEESGYTIYSCSVCSLTFKSDWIYSSGHTQGTVIEVVEATCTEDGYTKYQCSSCEDEFIDNWSYASGHNGDAIDTIEATCIEKGYTEHLCDSCGETYNSDFIAPIGHTFENDVCVNCNKVKKDCIESSHNYENNCDETWIISKPNADYITITFSSATETESGWDYIYIYDMDDNLIGQYSGTELASQTITVIGNIVKIRLTSDSSVNKYGFAVSDICSYIKVTVNDVEVAMPENTIDSTAELRVDEIDINNIVVASPEEFDVATANVYDIYFEKDEQRVQPNGAVTVYIPVPSAVDGEKCKVFHIDESGNATDMNAVYENGYMVFTTDHFSYYALVEEKAGFIYGDANGDTVIDGRDVVRLKNYLANYDYDTETSTVEIFDGADANGDSIIDGRDVIRLKNYLANYDYDTDSSSVVLGPQN